MLGTAGYTYGGGPCDYCVIPSPLTRIWTRTLDLGLTKLPMSLSHENHHYYIHNVKGKINDRKYDVFDRSDEQKIKADVERGINFSKRDRNSI